MYQLSATELNLIYEIIGRVAQRQRFRFKGRSRLADDGEEAQHRVFEILVQRTQRFWDARRPLEAYIASAAGLELNKFRVNMRRLERREGHDARLSNQ